MNACALSGATERSPMMDRPLMPRCFRYGAMKEAFPVWHETAMRFESYVAAAGDGKALPGWTDRVAKDLFKRRDR